MGMPSPCTAPELIESQVKKLPLRQERSERVAPETFAEPPQAKLAIQAVSMRGFPLGYRVARLLRFDWDGR